MAVSMNWGSHVGVLFKRDPMMLGSILGPPDGGNPHVALWCIQRPQGPDKVTHVRPKLAKTMELRGAFEHNALEQGA